MWLCCHCIYVSRASINMDDVATPTSNTALDEPIDTMYMHGEAVIIAQEKAIIVCLHIRENFTLTAVHPHHIAYK